MQARFLSRVPATPARSPARPDTAPAETLAWTAFSARRQPGHTLLALGAMGVTWFVALYAFGSPLLGIVGSLAVLGSVAEGLFPIHHKVTEKGVSTRCGWQMRSMPWTAVKTATQGPDGIHLSPLSRRSSRSRLGRTRGVTLRFADGNDSDVCALVRRYWKGEAAEQERSAPGATEAAG